MDHDENVKSNVVTEHHAHTEVNGYEVTTKLEDRDGKKILVFSVEKEEGFTEQEIRFFENGLKKSVSFFDPNLRKPAPDRFNNRYNNSNSQPRYNNGNTYNNDNRRYNRSNPHPNYKNRYGGWDNDIN